jgi:hypothetical protein
VRQVAVVGHGFNPIVTRLDNIKAPAPPQLVQPPRKRTRGQKGRLDHAAVVPVPPFREIKHVLKQLRSVGPGDYLLPIISTTYSACEGLANVLQGTE